MKAFSQKLEETSTVSRLGQSGNSGKTKFHYRMKAGKKPKGKFTSLKS